MTPTTIYRAYLSEVDTPFSAKSTYLPYRHAKVAVQHKRLFWLKLDGAKEMSGALVTDRRKHHANGRQRRRNDGLASDYWLGYTVSLLRRFRGGTRRVSQVAQHDLVTVLSLPTPPKCFVASVNCDAPCCLRPKSEGSGFGFQYFRGHLRVHFRYGPVTRSPSIRCLKMSLSIGFRILSLLPSRYSSYGALTFTPVGLTPGLRPPCQHACNESRGYA